MKNIDPRIIVAESPQQLVLTGICDGRELLFKFTLEPGPISVLLHEDAFYLKTHDDQDAAYWVTQAVSKLQKAYTQIIELNTNGTASSLQPLSVSFKSDSGPCSSYLVRLKGSDDSVAEYTFTVTGIDPSFSISTTDSTWEGKFDYMDLSVDAEDKVMPLLESILSLHKARSI